MAFIENDCRMFIDDEGVFRAALSWTPETDATGYDVEYHAQYSNQILSNITWSLLGGDCCATPSFDTFDREFTGFFRVRKLNSGDTGWSTQIRVTNESWPDDQTNFTPDPLPLVTDQWVWGAGDGPDANGWQGQPGCCTANALATMMELLYAKRTSAHDQAFSISWINGNRASTDLQGNMQDLSEALNRIVGCGALRYNDLPQTYKNDYCNYPEHLYFWPYDPNYYYDWTDGSPVQNFIGTKTLVDNNKNVLGPIAERCKLASWSHVDIHASTVDDIKAAITNNGCVVFDMRIADNFYAVKGATCNGVVPLPDKYTGNSWHALPVYGWKFIGGKLHWLAQPNWGDWNYGDQVGYGDQRGADYTAGRLYIPMDYPCISWCYIGVEGFNFPTVYASTPTQNGCMWSIGDLSAIWNSDNYIECCICLDANHPSGSYDPPSNILQSQTATTGTNNFTPSVTFTTGLSPSTTYSLYGYVKAANGLWYHCGSVQITTALATPYLDAYDSTATGITISIALVTHANRYYATCNGQQQYNSTGDFSWSGLIPNQQYQVTYYVADTGGTCPTSAPAEGYVSTKDPTPGTPNIGVAVEGDAQVTVTWDKPAGDYVAGYQYYCDGALVTTLPDTNPTTSYTFTGLTNGTAYSFKCRAYAFQNNTYFYSGFSPEVTATPENSRPAPFTWRYAGCQSDGTLVDSSDGMKSSSYRLYVAAGNADDQIEWYALIRNVQDMYIYKGYGASIPTMNDVTAGTNMLASQFTQVANAITWLYNTCKSISPVTTSIGLSGSSDILAEDFNTLRLRLNEIT